ncbi:hypothetical protein CNR33_00077 [Pseudomonas phage tabernarius]|uniref:Uncharacterized protein n=1 Tax=Pseudomonas phage tabernarius TaxID=2048978 RepID=A0A2H4P6W2_9CAUD|nr:hypothetical protein FDJ17_gp77 [Pseudomonas phage tabernarius]ATW57923.1 hypothetical protein CNR33_00077 [Pseudomonas phage tabernarius]
MEIKTEQSKKMKELYKERKNSIVSLFVTGLIIVSCVSFIAGREYAKHEIRASYCSVFGGDPRCK